MNALRPRSRPDYRTACVTSRHHRRCSSVRSPAGVSRRHHGGRPATRHPHCASLLRCRCGRPAAAFHVPSAAAATAATNSAARSRSRRVPRTPYRLRHRPATRRCGLIIMSARVAGLAGRCHPQAWWQPPVIRTGTVSAASLAAVAFRRPAHRPAASQAPCVPVRTPTFTRPQCGSRRQRQSACHNAGRGRGRRAAGARSLRVDTRPSPHARRPDRLPPNRARPASR